MNNKKINVEIIENYMNRNYLTNKEFCELCNISLQDFEKLLQDDTNVSMINLINIAKVIKCKVEDLVNRKNFT